MRFIVDIPYTDNAADTDPEKSDELWRSAVEQDARRTWGPNVTVIIDDRP